MIIKDKRKERQERMKNLYEKLTNMPEIDGKRVHGEVDAVVLDAVDSSNERDKKVKDSFKEKNAEVKKFIEEQDKATGVEDDEYKSSRRLFLDEELFKDAKLSSGLKESKESKNGTTADEIKKRIDEVEKLMSDNKDIVDACRRIRKILNLKDDKK